MFLEKNRWKKLATILMVLGLFLGFNYLMMPETAKASEETVFTVSINGEEAVSYTMAEIKAMPVTTKTYGETGFYVRKGVDFISLLESLGIDYNSCTVKLIMTDVPNGYTLNFSNVIEPLLAYEESTGGSDFEPFKPNPLKLYYGDGSNHKLVYQNVVGIDVIRPETLTPPSLEADITDSTVGKSIDLTFEDDEAWRDAITEVTVDDTAIASDKYTLAAGKLTIDASVFTAAGDYVIAVKATGYEDAAVTQTLDAAPEPAVFTVSINGEEAVSYTMAEIKAMPVTTKTYGETGFYVRKGVDFISLLESLGIDYNSCTVKLIMTDVPNGYTLNFSNVIEPLLAYEESTGGSDFEPFKPNPLKLYYGDGSNHKLVYQNVVGIDVIRPETLTPPSLEADITDSTVGKSIDLTFEDDEAWRDAITEVTVDDTAIASDKYTLAAGKLTIDASVFTAAGDYVIAVKATGYEDATVTQTVVEEVVSDTYSVTFAVKDGETAVEGATIEVKDSAGEAVAPEVDGTYELEAGNYTYTVTKAGYKEATGAFTVESEAVAINVSLEKEAVGKPPVLTAAKEYVGNPVLIGIPILILRNGSRL